MSPARRRHASGRLEVFLFLCGLLLAAPAANAQEEPSAPAVKPPAPYVLPWALRPIIAPTVVRLDSSLGFYDAPSGEGATTFVTGVLGGYKVPGTGGPTEGLSLFGKLTVATDSVAGGSIVANPILGAGYAGRFGHALRWNAGLFTALPLGMGGGNDPLASQAGVRGKAILTRAAMENAIYASNDLVIFPGVGFAWVDHGVTLQAEATLLMLIRVRGEERQPEDFKVNLTTGFFAGYFVVPKMLSLGLELRYQRWLQGPNALEMNPAATDNLTLAGGVRFHHEIEPGKWLRCGISYARALDAPMTDANYNLVQVDCPLLF